MAKLRAVAGVGLLLLLTSPLLLASLVMLPHVKVGPPAHNYEHEAGSYGDGFT